MIIRLLLKIALRIYNVIVYVFNIFGSATIIPLNWKLLIWNYRNWKTKRSNLIEWNYHMIFTDEVIGSYGLCVINPNKLPVIPKGLIFMAYGVFKKTQKPFTLFRMIPISSMTDSKSWPSSTKNPMEFQYISEKQCRIQITNADWSVDLDITDTASQLSTYLINDNNMGPLGQHWTVTNPWESSATTVTGTVATIKPDGSTQPPRSLSGRAYFENSGGCTFLINMSWFFLVHASEDFSFSFQSYYRSPSLTELLLSHDNKQMIFDHKQMKISDIDEFVYDLRDYNQLVPKTCKIVATNATHKLVLNFATEHYVEAEKHNPGEKTNVFFKSFFIMCLVGRVSATLTNLESDEAPIKFDEREFCGEYAKHNLFHASISDIFLPK
jgi:hypothetical protein